MSKSKAERLTDPARVFLEPANATHRQYEALRAYFVDKLSSIEAARRFGYSPGSFRVLCWDFRRNPGRSFFVEPRQQPRRAKTERLRERIVELRKNSLSIYDISRALAQDDVVRSPAAIASILGQEGFARLPRRRDDERPSSARPDVAPVADCRKLDLNARTYRTAFGGLFQKYRRELYGPGATDPP